MKFYFWNFSLHSFSRDLDSFFSSSLLSSHHKILQLNTTIGPSAYHIYTAGSGLEDGVGFAVCVFFRGSVLPTFIYKLNSYNSVFQSELLAIYYAVKWCAQTQNFAFIFSDSYSSLDFLTSYKNRSSSNQNLKSVISEHTHIFNINWIRAQRGPRKWVRRSFCEAGNHCGFTSFFSCSQVFSYIDDLLFINILPSPLFDNFVSNPFIIYLITGHGSFPSYLCRFQIWDFDLDLDCL